MDLSIIERVFALRDEMEKAQIGLDVPELAELERENDPERFKRLEHPADEQMAARFVARAIELDAESEKWHEAAHAPEPRSRPEIVELLAAASAPLPTFDEAELGSVAVPEPPPTEPVVTRPPTRPPVREPGRERAREPIAEPVRDAAPRDADAPPAKPRRKTAKKKPKKPKKKPE